MAQLVYALDSECLAKISTILGDQADSERFTADYERISSLVRQCLWN
jgi:hypothetical protein